MLQVALTTYCNGSPRRNKWQLDRLWVLMKHSEGQWGAGQLLFWMYCATCSFLPIWEDGIALHHEHVTG
jgi:hypothetical protein